MSTFPCRICNSPVRQNFCNLGESPLANSYLDPSSTEPEKKYPLHAFVCDACFLVQLGSFETPESIFSEYAYFSSFSSSWLEHSKRYVEKMRSELSLDEKSLVVEVASNDGYLLQYFVERDVPVLGIEPAANVAATAVEKGVRTEVRFLGAQSGQELREQYGGADLVLGNNVIAHVPDLHDFIEGVRALLKPGGLATFEFPHVMRQIEFAQFDTIYHEHFSYFSLHALARAFGMHEMAVFDVEELPTHGGSLRLYVKHGQPEPTARLLSMRELERERGLLDMQIYAGFQAIAESRRDALRAFLEAAKGKGRSVAGYGAPAKGNTLLNFAGVTADLLPLTVDKNPYKQGKLLPGTRIPIASPKIIGELRPENLLILPWNLRNEIEHEMKNIRAWGGKFVVAIPQLESF